MKEVSTVGFIFDKTLEHVLLICKNRPEWQKGKYNGIGGKLEKGETFLDAIVRETREETGLNISKEKWIEIGTSKSVDWEMWIFTTQYMGDKNDIQSLTDEKVSWHSIEKLPKECISNLFWKIPLCLGKIKTGNPKLIHITL